MAKLAVAKKPCRESSKIGVLAVPPRTCIVMPAMSMTRPGFVVTRGLVGTKSELVSDRPLLKPNELNISDGGPSAVLWPGCVLGGGLACLTLLPGLSWLDGGVLIFPVQGGR